MTLTLTLTPDKETRLAEQARLAGLSLDEYAQRVLDRAAAGDAPPATRLTSEERIARLMAWAESHGHDTPLLTDEAIRREAIYSRD